MARKATCEFCENPERAVQHRIEDRALHAVAEAAVGIIAARGLTAELREKAEKDLLVALNAFREVENSVAAASVAIKSLKSIEESLS